MQPDAYGMTARIRLGSTAGMQHCRTDPAARRRCKDTPPLRRCPWRFLNLLHS